jgi:hypothetical protein
MRLEAQRVGRSKETSFLELPGSIATQASLPIMSPQQMGASENCARESSVLSGSPKISAANATVNEEIFRIEELGDGEISGARVAPRPRDGVRVSRTPPLPDTRGHLDRPSRPKSYL